MVSAEAPRSRTRRWRSTPAPRSVGRISRNPSRRRASRSISTSSTPRLASPTASCNNFLPPEHPMDQPTAARKADFSAWTGRVEDDPLLRGQGRFGDDVKPEGVLSAYFVRSPHAFAKIERIDASEAKKSSGVVAVLPGADLHEAHYHSISHAHPMPGRGGKLAISPHRAALAEERVMHVGEPVSMVVATSAAAAQDAGEKVAVDYQPLDPVTDARAAVAPGAPQLWPDAPGNVGFDWSAPADADGKKQAALERAFKEAAHVVRVELVNQRLVCASLEPRIATARYDAQAKQ